MALPATRPTADRQPSGGLTASRCSEGERTGSRARTSIRCACRSTASTRHARGHITLIRSRGGASPAARSTGLHRRGSSKPTPPCADRGDAKTPYRRFPSWAPTRRCTAPGGFRCADPRRVRHVARRGVGPGNVTLAPSPTPGAHGGRGLESWISSPMTEASTRAARRSGSGAARRHASATSDEPPRPQVCGAAGPRSAPAQRDGDARRLGLPGEEPKPCRRAAVWICACRGACRRCGMAGLAENRQRPGGQPTRC